MTKCPYTSTDQLPLLINTDEIATILGISLPLARGLMNNPSFPSIPIGKRKLIPLDSFLEWMDHQTVNG